MRNEAWAMDFVSDQLHDGIKFRALTVVDTYTRECLAIEPGKQINGEDDVRVLSRIATLRDHPQRVFCDNGSQFTCEITDLWAYSKKAILAFSRPGKPTDKAFIESLNGTLRDECLNCHWFVSMEAS